MKLLQNATEALQSVVKHYGGIMKLLQNVAGVTKTLQKRCGSLRDITEPLRNIMILSITNSMLNSTNEKLMGLPDMANNKNNVKIYSIINYTSQDFMQLHMRKSILNKYKKQASVHVINTVAWTSEQTPTCEIRGFFKKDLTGPPVKSTCENTENK